MLKGKHEVFLEMAIKKSRGLHHSTFNAESPRIFSREFFTSVPRSVCDTERDRRHHRDPLKEEELQ
jgi:hypothetical protein